MHQWWNEWDWVLFKSNKRGVTLTLDRMEDPSLQNEIRVSVLISGFDSKD
jgi:hypothetical protein